MHDLLTVVINALIMGVVEGLTEFLPISSTGHLILTASLLGMKGETTDVFIIAIQTGAILAVVLHYWRTIWGVVSGLFATEKPVKQNAQKFTLNLLIAFTPAVVLALTFSTFFKTLFTPTIVASTFILGGIVILWAERRQATLPVRVTTVGDMTAIDALKVGLAQCLALIPGTSRSGATIIGGMLFGMSRTAATEFSFFLAMPTLCGAAAYDVYKHRDMLSIADLPMFSVGFMAAFFSAWLCIRWLLRYVSTHTFTGFAWYRIAFGLLILATAGTGIWVK